jgi:hypothetical protein
MQEHSVVNENDNEEQASGPAADADVTPEVAQAQGEVPYSDAGGDDLDAAGDDSDAPVELDDQPGLMAALSHNGTVRAEHVTISQAGANSVEAQTVSISQGGAGQIRAGELTISQGGVALARTESLTVDEGGSAFAVMTDSATVEEGGNVFLLIARSVSGDVSPVLDWRAALAMGAGFGLFVTLLRRWRR